MKHDNQNFILAIALSVAIILGWQFFYAQPKLEEQRKQQEIETQRQTNANDQSVGNVIPQPGSDQVTKAAPAPGDVGPGTILPREQVIAATPRVRIDTPKLTGSINLVGARLDDLRLKDYRLTVDPDSPMVTLLMPAGSAESYYAEDGWTAAAGADVALPDPKSQWTAPDGAVLKPGSPVTLTWDNGAGLTFKKTVSVDDEYMFTVRQEIDNTTGAPVTAFPYSRIHRVGVPHLQGAYVVHEGPVGVLNDSLTEYTYKDMKKDGSTEPVTSTGGWLGITDKYWAVATIPDQKSAVSGAFRYIPQGEQDRFQADYLVKDGLTVPAGGSAAYQSNLFAGAKVVSIVSQYDTALGIHKFDLLIDWGWLYFLTKPMFWLIDHIYKLIGNFGIAIMIVTVLVKAVFFPLANKSYKSMSEMKKLQPEMQKIRERFADDKVKQQQATMELYKNAKVSPLSGCLPILLQIPVFFALYKVIYVTIEMRHAPFFLWIRDLSAPDPTSLFNLFGLLPYTPPHFLMIGVLPLIMGVTMWIQMKLNPAPPDPIQAQMFNLMPLFFTFLLASFPAGLVLYWAWNNFLGIVQQWTIMKRQGVDVDLLGNIRSSLPSRFGKKPAE